MPAIADETVAISHAPDPTPVVDAILQRCSQIATLPAVTAQIIRLSEDPDATSEDLNRLIANDPALGLRILKLVNSAYYGIPGQVNSIERAISLLGQKAIRNIAIAASLVRQFRGGLVSAEFSADELWTHSVAVAAGTRMLARQTRLVAADEAFLAGLIHDTGILVEMQACGPDFARMIQALAAENTLTFRRAEEEVLGASHEAFGAGLCKAWNFPASLQHVTGYHHRPWALAEADRLLPTLVHIADVLAARLGLGYARTVETTTIDPLLADSVRLTDTDLDEAAEGLPAELRESERSLSDEP